MSSTLALDVHSIIVIRLSFLSALVFVMGFVGNKDTIICSVQSRGVMWPEGAGKNTIS